MEDGVAMKALIVKGKPLNKNVVHRKEVAEAKFVDQPRIDIEIK